MWTCLLSNVVFVGRISELMYTKIRLQMILADVLHSYITSLFQNGETLILHNT